MMTVFDRILSNESFADVTLVCGETELEIASSIKESSQTYTQIRSVGFSVQFQALIQKDNSCFRDFKN